MSSTQVPGTHRAGSLLQRLSVLGVETRSARTWAFRDQCGRDWFRFTLASPGDVQRLLTLVTTLDALDGCPPAIVSRAHGLHDGGLPAWSYELASVERPHAQLTAHVTMSLADAEGLADALKGASQPDLG
jgi:hypothetical protein